jgi:plasmid maintenance system killer protein
MNKNTTVLNNLLSHFPRSDFEKAVKEHGGDKGVRTLGCLEFFKGLLFGQVTQAFSVREIESSLQVNASKLYHCGMKPISRSTLCDALEKRDCQIFEKTFYALVSKAQQLSARFQKKFKNPLKVIDASTMEVSVNRFPWAKFRTTKGAVKIHVRLNGDAGFPEAVRMTNGAVHEVNQMSVLSQEKQCIYVLDRGYVDFKRLHGIHLNQSFFVTRMKENCHYDLVGARSYSQTGPIRFDSLVRLSGDQSSKDYPDDLRRIEYHDSETNLDYVFMTNAFDLPAQEIADIYKARWQIELFFKWMKQNLKIKTFWGTSSNAVYTQLWVALITYLLLWISKVENSITPTIQRILQAMKTAIFANTTISQLFEPPPKHTKEPDTQLCFQGLTN